jgi:hypothetical protein
MLIAGENAGFNGTSYPTFTPGGSITTLLQIGFGDLMGVLVLLAPNAGEGMVDLAITTTNGEGDNVTFTKEKALNIGLLPLILDDVSAR